LFKLPARPGIVQRGVTMSRSATAILSAIAMLFGTSAFSGGWQQPTKIDRFVIEGSAAGERIYVQFEADFNPDECSGNETQWKRIHGDTEKGKYLLSAVISAKAAGQSVVPLLFGCDDWGRPRLTGMLVQ